MIHKLFEEVLTGETSDGLAALASRAADLIRDLGQEPSARAATGLSASEIAGTVSRTFALPEIATIRPRLIAELPVYGARDEDGIELATFGIVDALCIGADGEAEMVIDWKSDVQPTQEASDHYRLQVRNYLEVTGIPRGIVVFATSGILLPVSR